MEAILATMHDVDGVIGSFFLGEDGRLVGRDLPSVIDDGAIGAVGPRIGRLAEALATGGQLLEGCTMRFGSYQLYVRPCAQGLLCVLTRADCTSPALRMAAKLVARRLGSGAVPEAAPAREPPVTERPLPAAEPARPRLFRGRRVE